ENIELYYSLAVCYEKLTQYSKALAIYESILSLELGYKDVMDRLQHLKGANLLDGAAAPSATSMKRMLGARYELLEKIGQDNFGTLYKAQDTSLGRIVMIRRFADRDQNITKEIVHQTRIISALNHSNILQIYDSGKDSNHYFICTEYVEGST